MPVSACIVSSSPHNIAQTPAALLLPPFSTRSPSPSGSNVVALPDDALYLEPASEPRPGTSLTARLHTHTHTHPPIRGRHSPFPLAYNCNCNCITARPDLNYLLSGPPSDHTLIHPPPRSLSTRCVNGSVANTAFLPHSAPAAHPTPALVQFARGFLPLPESPPASVATTPTPASPSSLRIPTTFTLR